MANFGYYKTKLMQINVKIYIYLLDYVYKYFNYLDKIRLHDTKKEYINERMSTKEQTNERIKND